MTGLGEIFAELGISQYLSDFVDQGFDTWETILDIKESDFDALNVKLGHRRKLQRKIANARGISTDRALESPGQGVTDGTEDTRSASVKAEGSEHVPIKIAPQGAKRKYRRHPKTDENAPERPPSAYVIFSNKKREDLKGRNLSFTEIAKLVGEHWQNLSPQDKEPFESHAAAAKERYLGELAEYKKTEQYKEYSAYLIDFKTRQQSQATGTEVESAKRPKMELQQPSTSSSVGTVSSGGSYAQDSPKLNRDISASSVQWSDKDAQPNSHMNTAPQANRGLHPVKANDPNGMSLPSVLPGYRESIIFGGNTPNLSWRDHPHEESSSLQRMTILANLSDTRPGPFTTIPRESRPMMPSMQSHQSLQASNPPSLITQESTNSNSSSIFQPRTPLESPGDRTLPPIYPSKALGHFDSQLPPIRPPSLSPQTSSFGQSHSPGGMPHTDYSSLRGYGRAPLPAHTEARPPYSSSNNSEETLQPFSTLLKAVNTVTRNSQQSPH